MKFWKRHKMLSFAIASFIVLSGANFFMVYEIIKIGMKIVLTYQILLTLKNKSDKLFLKWESPTIVNSF